MIELIDVLISNKKAPKEPISFSYEKGTINYINEADEYKYRLLTLRNQSLDAGTFKVDGITIYPNDNNEQSLFFLTVNSLIRLHLCFLCENKQKNERVKAVQERLISLRELPVETEEDKHNKISAIFQAVNELQPSYVLMDLNDEVNDDFDFIKTQLDKYKESLLFIILNKKAEQTQEIPASIEDNEMIINEDDLELNIGRPMYTQKQTTRKKKNEPPIIFSKTTDSFSKVFVAMFKENLMAFLSFIAPTLGVIAFCLLSPLYAQTNNVLLIPFIITIAVCFVLYMLMTYRCAIFENRYQLISYTLITAISVLIAYGLSLGIYFLFLNFDPDIKALQSKNIIGFVTSGIATLVLIGASLYLRPLILAIFKLFKKKK